MVACRAFCVMCLFLICAPVYADSDIAAAERPFLEGRYDTAAYEAGRLIDARASQRHEIYYLKGLSELKLNKFEAARGSFNAIISKYPNSNRVFDAYIGVGDSFSLAGDWTSAARAYTDALEKFPDNKNVVIARARLSDRGNRASLVSARAVTKTVTSSQSPHGGSDNYMSVQVGSFKSKRNADNLSKKLSRSGYDSYVEPPLAPNDKLYRVKIGRLGSRGEAESLAARLNRSGYKTKICDNVACG